MRLTPKAKATRLNGLMADADGGGVLKASVTAPPDRGKANKALLALLTKTWGMPKSDFSVAAGTTARNKQIHVAGEPAALHRFLNDWITENYG